MDYTAKDIKIIRGLEAVRRHPAMYIGDTGIIGLHHTLNEVIDNSVDEALEGHCNYIRVTLHKDGSASVLDNGRGIPVDEHPEEKKSALEVVMTTLHAGSKFSKTAYKISGGLHGVGVSCVNAVSEWLIAEVYRDGKIYRQKYKKGIPVTPVQVVGETSKRGTYIRFKPDYNEIFDEGVRFKREMVAARLRELAFLNPGLKIELVDERELDDQGKPVKQVFYSKEGLLDLLKYLEAGNTPLFSPPVYIKGEREGIIVEAAFEYTDFDGEIFQSYVNNINTREGGYHETGFRSALTRTLKNFASKQGWLNKTKVKIEGQDFKRGLLAVLSVKVPNPQFSGQTKTRLASEEVRPVVESIVTEQLNRFFENYPDIAKKIFEKVLENAELRKQEREFRKKLVKRKSPLSKLALPGKLTDCVSRKPQECELFIVEGDSAGGTAKQARNRNTQAILPLRGKVKNVEKDMGGEDHLKPLKNNAELRDILIALGVDDVVLNGKEYTEKELLKKLRYHKIIIMTDADVDGKHITTLLLTFFYRYLKPLIEQGMIYIAQPPLFMVRSKKGKGKKYAYCWSEEERDQKVNELGGWNNVEVQRYKGLGEMNAEQLWETTMNPVTRKLKRVTIEDAVEADRIFSILMGKDTQARRKFIEENAAYAELDV